MVHSVRQFLVASSDRNTSPELISGTLDRPYLFVDSTVVEIAHVDFKLRGGCAWLLCPYFHDGGLSSSRKETALKILRPDQETIVSDRAMREFQREVTVLTELQHPNIVKYLASGLCSVQYRRGGSPFDAKSPYYFLEYEDAHPLNLISAGFWGNGNDTMNFACGIIESTLSAVAYLHSRNIAHLDIHPGNLLAERSGRAILIDFGKAAFAGDSYNKNKGDNYPSGSTFVGKPAALYSDVKDSVHPQLQQLIDNHRGRDGAVKDEPAFKAALRTLLSSQHFSRFDLYALSSTLSKFLEGVRSVNIREDAPARESIMLVLTKLRDLNAKDTTTFSADQAREAILQIRQTLHAGDVRLVRLGGGNSVRIPDTFAEIMDTRQFQRLRGVSQLGLTSMIYPSATHTRFSHSLGAFDLSGRYLSALIRNSSRCRVELSGSIRDAVRKMVLIHDIGHYPFAHYFEELVEPSDEVNRDAWVYQAAATQPEFVFHHETLGRLLCRGEVKLDSDGPEDAAREAKDQQVLNKLVASDGPIELVKAHPLADVLNGLLSGPLDCDKVDYLVRDGIFCGVPYGASIDIERLLTSLTAGLKSKPQGVHATEDKSYERPQLMITEKGIAPVESILASRYQMFSEVYWHKAARGIAAMLKQALHLILVSSSTDQAAFWHTAANCNDGEFLDWLYGRLKSVNPEAAKALIHGLRGRRDIYKRGLTLSAAWEEGDKSLYRKTLSRVIKGVNQDVSFMRTQTLQLELCNRLSQEFKTEFATWEVLIDVPPGHAKDEDFPHVVYGAADGVITHSLSDVSGLLHSLRRSNWTSKSSLLGTTHRIRVYLSPDARHRLQERAAATSCSVDKALVQCMNKVVS